MKTTSKKAILVIVACIAMLVVPFVAQANFHVLPTSTIADSVYERVDEMAYLKKYKKSTPSHIQKQLTYPDLLKIKGVEGNVLVSFTVSSDGRVLNATTSQEANAEFCEEALKAVMNSGPWVPAKVGGQFVDSKMSIMLKFELLPDERQLAQNLKSIDFDNKPPLFILDGKVVEGVLKIENYNVKSIRVIKGEKALALYGEKARYGVVEVASKNGTPPVR